VLLALGNNKWETLINQETPPLSENHDYHY
jgi:hypothetical protein